MPAKRVQCSRCGQTFTEKQFEKHKKICRGDEPPALSGDEDNSEFSDAEFVVIEDEYDGYPRERVLRR